MALCLATSLVERNGFDAHDQMARYCAWAKTGCLSSTGARFDIGGTVASASRRFRPSGQIAGAYYGARQIPAGWLERLALRS